MLADVLDFLRLTVLFKIRDLHHLLVLQDLTWLLLFDSGCISIFFPPHLWPQGLLGKTCHNHLEVTKHNCACGYDWSKNTCLEGAPWNTPASLNVGSDSKCVPIKENSVYFLQSPLLLPVGNKGVCQKVYHHRKWSDPLVYMAALIQTPSSWPHYKEHLFHILKGSVWDHKCMAIVVQNTTCSFPLQRANHLLSWWTVSKKILLRHLLQW